MTWVAELGMPYRDFWPFSLSEMRRFLKRHYQVRRTDRIDAWERQRYQAFHFYRAMGRDVKSPVELHAFPWEQDDDRIEVLHARHSRLMRLYRNTYQN